MALTGQSDFSELVTGYLAWLDRAEQTVVRLLPAAEANLFNSVAPPLGKEHDMRRRGEDAILAAIGRRLAWLEAAAGRYQRMAVAAVIGEMQRAG